MALRWIEKQTKKILNSVAHEQLSPRERHALEASSTELFTVCIRALAAEKEQYTTWNENCRSLVSRAEMVRTDPSLLAQVLEEPSFTYSLFPPVVTSQQTARDTSHISDRSQLRELTVTQARYGIEAISSQYHIERQSPLSLTIRGRRPGFYSNQLGLIFFPEPISSQGELDQSMHRLGFDFPASYQEESSQILLGEHTYQELQGYRLPGSTRVVWAYYTYAEEADRDRGSQARIQPQHSSVDGLLRPAFSTLR